MFTSTSNPPTRKHLFSLVARIKPHLSNAGHNPTIYWLHVELYKYGYIIGELVTSAIRDRFGMLSTLEIRNLHEDIMANEHKLEEVFTRDIYVRLAGAVNVAFSDEESLDTLLLTMQMLIGKFQTERGRRDSIVV
jgi:hypothetical protein